MHEVSIMMSLLEIVLEQAHKAEAKKVVAVNLEIGAKSGVVADSLTFAFEMVVKNSIVENAKLTIDLIPFRGECLSCGHQFECDDFLICDQCGNFGKILSGRELRIQSIEVE